MNSRHVAAIRAAILKTTGVSSADELSDIAHQAGYPNSVVWSDDSHHHIGLAHPDDHTTMAHEDHYQHLMDHLHGMAMPAKLGIGRGMVTLSVPHK